MGDCEKAAREWKSLPGNRKVESVREERNKWHFMQRNIIIAEQIVQFYDTISQEPLSLPAGVKLLNPFCGEQKALSPFIVHALQQQLAFGLDTSVCYCIGSGENYRFLQKMNDEHKFFKALIPLEHPRYIMQYHSKQKKDYLEKYIKYFTKV